MENPKNFEVKITDIRQSPNWEAYLKTLGWHGIRTSKGTLIEYIKSGLGKVAKIQRPFNLEEVELQEIDDICKKENMVFAKLEPSSHQDINLLLKRGYLVNNFPLIPPSTIYLDLTQTEKELLSDISGSAKYSMNRAKREGTKIEFFRNPSEEMLKKFHTIAIETGKKKSFYVQEFNDLKTKAKIFGDEAYLVFVYDRNNNLSSAKFYLGFNKTVWYIHGGTTELGRKNKAGYELMWESIKYFKNLGYTVFDLEGIEDPRFPVYTHNWAGLTHFKEKFGGKTVRFPHPHVKIYNFVLNKLSKIIGPNF
jgi:lipid II:glycine glycyltransferase (peptidoglycan interpeptide bridge formation enzyme)